MAKRFGELVFHVYVSEGVNLSATLHFEVTLLCLSYTQPVALRSITDRARANFVHSERCHLLVKVEFVKLDTGVHHVVWVFVVSPMNRLARFVEAITRVQVHCNTEGYQHRGNCVLEDSSLSERL